LLVVLTAASWGCAATVVVAPRVAAQDQPVSAGANGPVRTTGGGRSRTVGLPLPRAAKIGLWTGVAVILALAMADSDADASDADSGDP
jgi:hypothetical protein